MISNANKMSIDSECQQNVYFWLKKVKNESANQTKTSDALHAENLLLVACGHVVGGVLVA